MSDRIVVGVLVQGGHVLLGLRSEGRTYGGHWALPGGHLEVGEEPADGLARELGEELGIRISIEHAHELARRSGPDRHIWAVPSWDGEIFNAAPLEHDRLGWFSLQSLAELPLAHPGDRELIAGAVVQWFGSEAWP